MRGFALAFALSSITGAAFAQDASPPVFDETLSQTCVDNASLRDEQGEDPNWESCIGVAANACMETPGGSSTVGMGYCLGRELDLWDARLNESYKQLQAQAEATDKEMTDLGSAAEKQLPLLRDMQRNWIAFRDSACDFERSRWGGGTGGGPAQTDCAMTQTARQYFWLRNYLD